jgi:Protein of unknown function (DUF3305)
MSVNVAAANDPTEATASTPSWSASVAFRKRPVTSRWADFEWDTASISVSDDLQMTLAGPLELSVNSESQWRWDGQRIELHHSEGEGYWLNLNSPQPCIFVMWRLEEDDRVPRPVVVTVSYNEAGRMLDAGDHVDNVPMPEAMKALLTTYTAANYKPEPRKKVKRNDPFVEGAYRRNSGSGAARG